MSPLDADHFQQLDIAARLAVALGVGLLVGIEREWSNKDLGARTFTLTALLGAITILVSPVVATVAFIGVLLLVAFANVRSLMVDRTLEATTSAALLLIFWLGALAGQGHLFTPVATAILITMLLAWKMELHRFAGGLRPEEIRSAVLLGLLGLVVYPLLPNRFIDPWNLVNPREAWIVVIVIAGLGFANYVLLKVYGTLGLYVSGFLGGLVNSTAAAELARTLRDSALPAPVAVPALLLTLVAMAIRNLVILAIFSPVAALTAAGPLLVMGLVALVMVWRARAPSDTPPSEIHLASPVSVVRVLSFAALFLLIQIVSTLGQRWLGALGFLGVSAIGGLVSSASTSAAAAILVGHGGVSPALAGEGVVLASVASALVNLPIIRREAHDPALARHLAWLTAIVCVASLAVLGLLRLI